MANNRKQSMFEKVAAYDDVQRNNYVGMKIHLITIIVFQIPAVLNMFNGVNVVFTIISTLIGIISPIMEHYFYKKDPHTPMVKHFVGFGFAVYYTVILFGSDISTIFTAVIPMLISIMIFNDVSYTLKINIGVIVEVFVKSVLMVSTKRFGYTDFESIFIENVAIILIAVFSVLTARTISINEKNKLDKIQELVSSTEQGVAYIYKDLSRLTESNKATASDMRMVTARANEAAAAVSDQIRQTDVIKSETENVEHSTSNMNDRLSEMVDCINDCSNSMNELLQHVDATIETSDDVKERLNRLTVKMEEMNSIANLITSITFQTKILAINANVEAAHAGSVGRGFAVVANEVSNMSVKISDATSQIVDIIDGVKKALFEVVNSIENMTDEIGEQRVSASKTDESFKVIHKNTSSMSDEVSLLVAALERLTNANHEILSTVDRISDVSEQVSSLAGATEVQGGKNTEVLMQVAKKMQNMVADK